MYTNILWAVSDLISDSFYKKWNYMEIYLLEEELENLERKWQFQSLQQSYQESAWSPLHLREEIYSFLIKCFILYIGRIPVNMQHRASNFPVLICKFWKQQSIKKILQVLSSIYVKKK